MNQTKKYTITAALPYANGPIHIGHLAGVYVPADVYARYLRAIGKDVVFLCGSDEHGVPITLKAKKENVSPQKIVNRYHRIIEKSFQDFNISFDYYGRTSDQEHHKIASDFFLDLYKQGHLIENEIEQFFDEKEQMFLADRYITGECPKCNHVDIYRDQCENCGSNIPTPQDLINIVSTLSGEKPILKTTKHWCLPFDEGFLRNWMKENKDWKPNVVGQILSWIDCGLRPRAITRNLDWGVPVPLEYARGKVLYVWFDAPIGYISATQKWAEKTGQNWKDYWMNDSNLIHFIGKDNIVFHGIIFPSMMNFHSENFNLPKNIPANEFLNLEDKKISTSNNWAVWLHEYLEDFPNAQDVLRYVLCANMPEAKDNNFTWKDFQQKNNSELVGILGNFVKRVVDLTHKYYAGEVPDASTDSFKEIYTELSAHKQQIQNNLEQFRFRNAIADYLSIARLGNKFLQDHEPWKLQKTDPEKVKEIMACAIDIVWNLAQVTEPFLPETAKKLSEMLNTKNFGAFGTEVKSPKKHQIAKSFLLFTRIEDQMIENQIEKLTQSEVQEIVSTKVEPQKTECTFDDFQKIDLRVGTILSAEKVKKADRLLELKVDTGVDTRTIVSGIAESFSPEEILNKQVMVLVNLAPRKIRGILSQGMLLLSEKPDGTLAFVSPEKFCENGTIIG